MFSLSLESFPLVGQCPGLYLSSRSTLSGLESFRIYVNFAYVSPGKAINCTAGWVSDACVHGHVHCNAFLMGSRPWQWHIGLAHSLTWHTFALMDTHTPRGTTTRQGSVVIIPMLLHSRPPIGRTSLSPLLGNQCAGPKVAVEFCTGGPQTEWCQCVCVSVSVHCIASCVQTRPVCLSAVVPKSESLLLLCVVCRCMYAKKDLCFSASSLQVSQNVSTCQK